MGQNPGPYFPDTYTETEGETEEVHGAPTPPGDTGPPSAAPPHGGGPTGVPRGRPFAYFKPLRPKTLSTRSNIHEKFHRRRHHQP